MERETANAGAVAFGGTNDPLLPHAQSVKARATNAIRLQRCVKIGFITLFCLIFANAERD
jgi:hypothetical protein